MRQRLDQNLFRQSRADAEARVANLANQIGVPAQELDLLLFAKTHFAQAMCNFRCRGELFDPNGHARIDAAQWAEERLRAIFRRRGVVFVRFAHWR